MEGIKKEAAPEVPVQEQEVFRKIIEAINSIIKNYNLKIKDWDIGIDNLNQFDPSILKKLKFTINFIAERESH